MAVIPNVCRCTSVSHTLPLMSVLVQPHHKVVFNVIVAEERFEYSVFDPGFDRSFDRNCSVPL